MKHNTTNTRHSRDKGKIGKIRTALLPLVGAGLALAVLTGCNQESNTSQSASASDSPSNQSAPADQTAQTASAAPTEQNAPATAAPSADKAHGQQLFTGTCSGCHGAQGQGVPHLGKDLQTSQFVAGLTDDKLADFITQGRAVTDPANTTHVPMPPKGGNPALSSQDISDIVAYLRQLQHEHLATK